MKNATGNCQLESTSGPEQIQLSLTLQIVSDLPEYIAIFWLIVSLVRLLDIIL
jgi:hypothetical protein